MIFIYLYLYVLGYNTKTSQEVFLKEGQKIEVRFRGNLQPDEEVDLIMAYNSHIRCQLDMYVAEIDKYAQKSFDSYRGFAQFYVEGEILKVLFHINCSISVLLKNELCCQNI